MVVTREQHVPTWAVKFLWMNRFGTSNRLDYYIPNLEQSKSAWLMKIKSCAGTLGKSQSATAHIQVQADHPARNSA